MIVADTHAWVWFASSPDRLSPVARRAIDEADRIGVSPISCWEVATLVRKGRLALDRDVLLWTRQALALPRIELLPISPQVAVTAAEFDDEFPGDPADRLIAATALAFHSVLLTKDRRLGRTRRVSCLW